MAGTEFTDAPEVRSIAGELVPLHHRHLLGVHFEFVFRDPAAKKGGRITLGTAQKVGGLQAHLADWGEDGFVIVIASGPWRDMSAKAKRALVDHELSHCQVDDEGGLHTIGHDVEDFTTILQRHGIWKPDLTEFAHAAAKAVQLRLEATG